MTDLQVTSTSLKAEICKPDCSGWEFCQEWLKNKPDEVMTSCYDLHLEQSEQNQEEVHCPTGCQPSSDCWGCWMD